jgi:DNA-directed RNA polymerase subunit RPC12/RpoP
MGQFIAVACLNCGHCVRLSDDDLARHRVARDVPLVTLTRRLACSECGSRAVQAFRQDESPSIGPE